MAESTALDQAAQLLASTGDDELLTFLVTVLEERPAAIQSLVDWAVPERALVRTSVFSRNRLRGIIKSFNAKGGFGFISCDEARQNFGGDVFLHPDQLPNPQVKEEVSFAIFLNKEGKPQAFDVKRHGASPPPAWGGAAPAWDGGAWSGADSAWNGPPAWGGPAAWAGKGKFGCKGKAACGGKGWEGGCKGWDKGGGKGWEKGWEMQSPSGGKGWEMHDPNEKAQTRDFNRDAPPSSVEMPGVTDQRWQGVLKMFKEGSGFGFIACEGLYEIFHQDVFAHHKQIAGLQVGTQVEFSVFLNKDEKPQAKDVQPAGSAPQRGWQNDAPPTAEDVPGVTDRRFDGIIKSIFEDKGYGFIACDELRPSYGSDVFVHQKQLGGFFVNQPVSFEVFLNKDGKPQGKSLMAAESNGRGYDQGGGAKRPRFSDI